MKSGKMFFFALLLLLSSTCGLVFAQDEKLDRKDLLLGVGDPATFQNDVRFLGVVSTGNVVLAPSCDPNFDDQDNRCIVLNPEPMTTAFDVRDIGRITLPGNTAKNLIYPVSTYLVSYQFRNTTGSPQPSALFSFVPYLTIESAALNDPRAVDDLGQPLNGKLDNVALSGGRAVERSLAVDERDFERLSYTRTELVGLAKMTFVFGFEIPADIVDRMFREPMTIRLNLSGAVRLVADDARNPRPTRLRYHMRLLGN